MMPCSIRLDGNVHGLSQFNGYLTKFTIFKELIGTLPGGRVVV